MPPRIHIEIVIGAHRERRNHVLTEIFVLVITPDQHHIGFEVIQRRAHPAKLRHQRSAVRGSGGDTAIAAPFGLHYGGPVTRLLVLSRNAGVFERGAQNPRHLRIRCGQRWVMRQA